MLFTCFCIAIYLFRQQSIYPVYFQARLSNHPSLSLFIPCPSVIPTQSSSVAPRPSSERKGMDTIASLPEYIQRRKSNSEHQSRLLRSADIADILHEIQIYPFLVNKFPNNPFSINPYSISPFSLQSIHANWVEIGIVFSEPCQIFHWSAGSLTKFET